jgi:hypothetical protein
MRHVRFFTIPESWFIDFNFELLNCVDQVSDTFFPFPPVRRTCLEYLRRICSLHNLPPTPMQFELLNNPVGIAPCRGGSADVFKCVDQNLEVAVKVLRTYSNSDLERVTLVSFRRPQFLWRCWRAYRNLCRRSTMRPYRGNSFAIQMCCRSLESRRTGPSLSLRWCRSGCRMEILMSM